MNERAEGTNRRFHYTATTTGSTEAIWERWTDPATWASWDLGLRSASLDRPFEVGATGTLSPDKGPSSTFEVIAVAPAVACEFATALPGARLHVHRELIGSEPTTFRHTVFFAGPMAWLWSAIYGRRFRRALPPTMHALAEATTAPSP